MKTEGVARSDTLGYVSPKNLESYKGHSSVEQTYQPKCKSVPGTKGPKRMYLIKLTLLLHHFHYHG